MKFFEFRQALEKIHDPKTTDEWERARRRLAFNELLLLQIQSTFKKQEFREENIAKRINIEDKNHNEFVNSLPFTLTNSQIKAVSEIKSSLGEKYPMNRLLEGDVGSGKTVVAGFGIFSSFVNNYQTVLLAPTQVLAAQHFNTLNNLLSNFGVRVSLVTGSETTKDLGRPDLLVGTHALLHRPALFDNVALLIIDEQHRFGVKQRSKLMENAKSAGHMPHVLSMTATPIPRTISLTLYGDLDLSSLDEMPEGRKPVKTWVVKPKKRKAAYKWIEEQISKDGVQAFVVCPLIDESDAETLKEVKAASVEYEKIRKALPKLKVGLLHGRLKPKEKEAVLNDFRKGKSDILVSTPVVEVGVDIANATIMMIEAADRFGLAQLHQLRGRVGRGDKQSYCLLFTENKSRKIIKRLEFVSKTNSGRDLAKEDLKTRGPGEIFGTKQHGLPEIKIARWTDIDLIKSSRKLAEKAVADQKGHKNIIKYYKSKQITSN